jgi:ERCC4-type nuclease
MKIQSTLPTDSVMIFVDNRESQSSVIRWLRGMDILITETQLEVGDYICSDRVCAERKTVRDFLQSIIDQRLFRQLENMARSFESPLLILEGNPELLALERTIHPNALRGALASIALEYKIPIIWTRNSEETAHQLFWIAQREQVKQNRPVQIRSNKKTTTLQQEQEYLVTGLPGISTTRAKQLLKKFKTPEKIFTASETRLLKLNGFGDKRIKRLKKVLKTQYKD